MTQNALDMAKKALTLLDAYRDYPCERGHVGLLVQFFHRAGDAKTWTPIIEFVHAVDNVVSGDALAQALAPYMDSTRGSHLQSLSVRPAAFASNRML